MKICRDCSHISSNSEVICTACGSENLIFAEKKDCKYCGKVVARGTVICPYCSRVLPPEPLVETKMVDLTSPLEVERFLSEEVAEVPKVEIRVQPIMVEPQAKETPIRKRAPKTLYKKPPIVAAGGASLWICILAIGFVVAGLCTRFVVFAGSTVLGAQLFYGVFVDLFGGTSPFAELIEAGKFISAMVPALQTSAVCYMLSVASLVATGVMVLVKGVSKTALVITSAVSTALAVFAVGVGLYMFGITCIGASGYVLASGCGIATAIICVFAKNN